VICCGRPPAGPPGRRWNIFRELGDSGLKKIGSGRVADAFIRRDGRSLPRSTRFAGGAGWCPGAEAETRTQTRQEPTDELRQRDRGAGGSRWQDTSQTCSPRGRLAIAADLPI
jgi:hypothetical protein